jgi:hypothetical protein
MISKLDGTNLNFEVGKKSMQYHLYESDLNDNPALTGFYDAVTTLVNAGYTENIRSEKLLTTEDGYKYEVYVRSGTPEAEMLRLAKDYADNGVPTTAESVLADVNKEYAFRDLIKIIEAFQAANGPHKKPYEGSISELLRDCGVTS